MVRSSHTPNMAQRPVRSKGLLITFHYLVTFCGELALCWGGVTYCTLPATPAVTRLKKSSGAVRPHPVPPDRPTILHINIQHWFLKSNQVAILNSELAENCRLPPMFVRWDVGTAVGIGWVSLVLPLPTYFLLPFHFSLCQSFVISLPH